MNSILNQILLSQSVIDDNGQAYPVHSHIELDQGLFLQNIIKKIQPKASLEFGLAFGISTLFILETITELKNDFDKYYIFDPYQDDQIWKNIGLKNISDAGYSNLISFEKINSHEGIIKLINKNSRIQFAYIDSTKIFDILIVDFFLIDKILDIGGVVVFDDCSFPGIKKLMRYISKLPHYNLYDSFSKEHISSKKKVMVNLASSIMQILPSSKKIFAGIDFKTDSELAINYHSIAFQKKAEDTRLWDWFENF